MSAHTSDTLPCLVCGTTLSACDWFSDDIGRLTVRCPNQHRHGTGWRAHPAPKPIPPLPSACEDCDAPLEQPGTGMPRRRCLACGSKRNAERRHAQRARPRPRCAWRGCDDAPRPSRTAHSIYCAVHAAESKRQATLRSYWKNRDTLLAAKRAKWQENRDAIARARRVAYRAAHGDAPGADA